MTIVILAGGLATRLGPLTRGTPKSMLPIAGEPFIAHQLRLLARNGMDRVHLCLGHLGQAILDFVGDGRRFGVRVSWSMDGDRLMGTAGALALARPHLGAEFGVLYGDSYLPLPFGEMARSFAACGKPGMMTVWRNRDALERSNLAVEEGLVVAYRADPADRGAYEWIDYGLSFLRAEALDGLDPDRPAALSMLWGRMAGCRELKACEVQQRFYEIGSPSGYRELCELGESDRMPGVGPAATAEAASGLGRE